MEGKNEKTNTNCYRGVIYTPKNQNRRKDMKKAFVLGLVIIMFAGLSTVACENKDGGTENGEEGNNGGEENVDGFSLTISVAETALPQGENFGANVELKNQSGKDLEISVSLLFYPMIPNWYPDPIDMPLPETILFPKDSVIICEPNGRLPPYDDFPTMFGVGGSGWGDHNEIPLPVGKHKLRFKAVFCLGSEQKRIEVLSNTIELTVLP
jgi:hypothetical protein